MKKILLLSSIFSFGHAIAQDYKTGLQFKDGFTAIYRTTYKPATSAYTSSTTVTRYGLMKDKQVVLPIQYNAVYYSYEPGIFIIKDSLDKQGLYNGVTRNFITPMNYYEIEIFSNGLATVKKQKEPYGFSWGAVDNKGNIAIPVEYDYIGSYSEGLINFKKDDRYGFLDRNNNIVIPNIYGNLSEFGNGLAPVMDQASGKYGYINKENKMVIPAAYEEADNFFKGYAVAKRKKGSSGRVTSDAEVALMNTQGKELTDFSYSFISTRQPLGLFLAKKGKLYGALDSTGKLVLPVEYMETSAFGDNYMQFKTTDKKYGLINAKGAVLLQPEYDYISYMHDNRIFYTKNNGKFIMLDKNLKTVIPADDAESVLMGDKRIAYFSSDKAKVFDASGKLIKTFMQPNLRRMGSDIISNEDTLKLAYTASIFIANLAGSSVKSIPYTDAGDFNDEGVFLARADNKYDFLDYTSKKLNSTSFYAVVNFSEGICAVQETSSSTPYLADKNFNKIKNLTTTFKGPYSEGLALSQNPAGTLDYLDKSGNKVFGIIAVEGGPCTDGRIWVQDIAKTYYYVDKTGKAIGNDRWPGIRLFSEGLSAVQKDGKWGFIDGTGTYIIQPKYDEASSFFNGAAIIKSNGKYMLIDKTGGAIDNNTYEGAGDPGKGGFPVMKGTKVGLIDSKGKILISFKYDNITPMNENRLWAMKGGKWALLENTGAELTGFIYTSGGEFKNGYAYSTIGDKAGMIYKTGKLALPVEYKSVGSVYKNMVLAVKGEGEVRYSIK